MKVRFAREVLVYLDKVRTGIGEAVHHGSGLSRRAHDHRIGRQGRIAIDAGAAGENARTWQLTLRHSTLDLVGQSERHIRRCVIHVPDTGDAVGQEQGELPVHSGERTDARIRPPGPHRMDVRVP